MKPICFLTLLIILCSCSAKSQEIENSSGRIQLELPKPSYGQIINLEDDEGNVKTLDATGRLSVSGGPFEDVILNVRVNPDHTEENPSYWQPPDFISAVNELNEMLPDDYKEEIYWHFGYRGLTGETQKTPLLVNVRLEELTEFLIKIWGVRYQETTFVSQFRCMGKVGVEWHPIFYFLTFKNTFDRDSQQTLDAGKVFYIIDNLYLACTGGEYFPWN